MKVGELIKELEKFDKDKEVIIYNVMDGSFNKFSGEVYLDYNYEKEDDDVIIDIEEE